MTDFESKTTTIPLSSKDALLALFKRALSLPRLMEFTVQAETATCTVKRLVSPGEEVLPPVGGPDIFDPEFLARCAVHENPEVMHPLMELAAGFAAITSRNLIPICLISPPGGVLRALFGLEGEEDDTHFMGLPVRYTDHPDYQEKIVLVGSATSYLEDAVLCVLLDIGA